MILQTISDINLGNKLCGERLTITEQLIIKIPCNQPVPVLITDRFTSKCFNCSDSNSLVRVVVYGQTHAGTSWLKALGVTQAVSAMLIISPA